MPQGETRFDSNITPHINLVCNKCGKIQDFSHSDLKMHIENVIMDTKFLADTVRVDVYGLCEKCASKIAKK